MNEIHDWVTKFMHIDDMHTFHKNEQEETAMVEGEKNEGKKTVGNGD